MQGVVFTEFLDHVEAAFGYEMVDAIIEDVEPASGGAYSVVGSYPFSELAALLGALAKRSGTSAPDLLFGFGEHLFARFVLRYGHVLRGRSDALSLLETIESDIHVEVRKLYPNAELPHLRAERVDANAIRLTYSSCRPLGHLCLGLIAGCGAHFGETLEVESETLADGDASAGLRMTIRRVEAAAA